MTEFEVFSLANQLIQSQNIVLGALFTLVFGYVAAQYFFLRHTRIAVRIFTFAFFVPVYLFVWMANVQIAALTDRWFDWRRIYADTPSSEATVARTERIELATGLMYNVFLVILIIALFGLFWLTFLYRWSERNKEL